MKQTVLKTILLCSLLGMMLLGLTACPPGCGGCGESEPIILKDIPKEVINKMYYKGDTIYKFKHSAGTIIEYNSKVTLVLPTKTGRSKAMACDCVGPEVQNEQYYQAELTTDYPIFDIYCYLSNHSDDYYPLSMQLGTVYFEMPITENDEELPFVFDKIEIDGQVYKEVFVLKNEQADYDKIEVDSLYYNHEYGIVKITKTNDEYYVRQD